MILTVTTNSALDRLLFIDRFLQGEPARAKKMLDCVGGKGFDTSVALRGLGVETVGLGFVAGETGKALSQHLEGYGIQPDLVWVEGETRLAHVIIETAIHDHSHIITSGSRISPEQGEALLARFQAHLSVTDFVVVAGSIADGLRRDYYRILTEMAREAGKPILIDCFGEAMARALPGHPTIAKMNEREFGETFQVKVDSRKHLLRLGKQVLEQYPGINLVLTLGKDGLLAITAQGAYQASSPQQLAVNAAGAGDAASAALAWRLSQGDGWEDALIWAVATSAASVLTEPTAEVRWEDVVRIHAEVKVEKVRNEG